MPLQHVLASAPHTLVEVAVVGSNPVLPLAGHTEDWNAAAVVAVMAVAHCASALKEGMGLLI